MADNVKTSEHAAKAQTAYQKAIKAAQAQFQNITAQGLALYSSQVNQAADVLATAQQIAITTRNDLMGPAQAAYDATVTMTEQLVADILGPAQTQFNTASQQASDAWQALYAQAETIYANQVNAAQQARSVSNLDLNTAFGVGGPTTDTLL